jgi:glutamate 5-kinase
VKTTAPKRVVIKLGTGVLTSGIGQLNTGRIDALAAGVASLHAAGTEVIVVSSGARYFLRQMLESSLPNVFPISHNEVPAGVKILSLGAI